MHPKYRIAWELLKQTVFNHFLSAGTTFLGAIAPDAAAPWYAGWTTYFRN